ncbi:hypothetical protein PUN28_019856 [Cardiocondyla obscurior]|uniref:Uncharacterized protein n=1 Tax=Cardiocondyla obscurior TaxID=286306 RepID=A0AAW2E7T8_9HYME
MLTSVLLSRCRARALAKLIPREKETRGVSALRRVTRVKLQGTSYEREAPYRRDRNVATVNRFLRMGSLKKKNRVVGFTLQGHRAPGRS